MLSWIKNALKSFALRAYSFLLALRSPFSGTYHNFAEAIAASRGRKRIGYDYGEMVGLYVYRIGHVNPSDYASMFWMSRLIREHLFVADFGGNVALEYSAFAKYLTFPASLKWLICDVPAVVEFGQRISRERGFANVAFTSQFQDFDGADVLHSSGTLQYIEPGLADRLSSLSKKPAHLIINRIPVHEREEFVTMQDLGQSLNPYHVYRRDQFIQSFTTLGYELVDRWQCAEVTFRLPFHPEKEIAAYSGFYFKLTDTPKRAG